MASIIQIGTRWRAQVRRRDHKPQTQTFETKALALKWSRALETSMDQGKFNDTAAAKKITFGALIARYKKERQRPIGRSHGYALDMIDRLIGDEPLAAISSDRLIRYARKRDCSASTWAAEISFIGQILRVARVVWKLPIDGDPAGDARVALSMLGYRMKPKERERRPTSDELHRLVTLFEARKRQVIPMHKIIPFAVATTMRSAEIARLRWADMNSMTRTITIRDRKDPRDKEGNDQEVPLLPDAWAIIESMPRDDERIFPFKHDSFSTIFPRACQELGIKDLHFHDLRHEGTSRLFEMGYAIQEVAVFTGHKDWKQLKRYTQIKASSLHRPQSLTTV